MSLLKWAIFGLLMLPMAEIAVFVAVALQIGFLAALALTILTSLAGMAVIRSAGTQRRSRACADRVRRRHDHPRGTRRAGLSHRAGRIPAAAAGLSDRHRRRAAAAADHPAVDPCGVASRRGARRAGERPAGGGRPRAGPVAPRARGAHRPQANSRGRIDEFARPCGLGACVSHTADRARSRAKPENSFMTTTNGGAAGNRRRRAGRCGPAAAQRARAIRQGSLVREPERAALAAATAAGAADQHPDQRQRQAAGGAPNTRSSSRSRAAPRRRARSCSASTCSMPASSAS